MAKKVGAAAARPSSKTKIMGALTAVAVGCAVIALGFAFMVNQNAAQQVEAATADQRPVVTTTAVIPAGTQVTEEMLSLSNVPGAYAVEGGSSALADVVGKTAVVDIPANAQVTQSSLTGDDANSLADVLEVGMYAYTVSIDTESGVAGNIHQGDYVDIITREDPSQTVYEDVKVIALDASTQEDGQSNYGSVTLEVTPEQALELESVKAEKSLRFVLSSTAQHADETVENAEQPVANAQ